jgi:hypothetical protein
MLHASSPLICLRAGKLEDVHVGDSDWEHSVELRAACEATEPMNVDAFMAELT